MSIIKRSFVYIMFEDIMHDARQAEMKDKILTFFQSLLCILIGTFDYEISIKLDYIYHRGTVYQQECLHGYSKHVILCTLVTFAFGVCMLATVAVIAMAKYLLHLNIG